MLASLRRLAKKSKIVIISYHIYDNWCTKRRLSVGRAETFSGYTHTNTILAQRLSYINQVFDDYLKYSGISVDTLRAKRILEIGPGDNFGVALKFLIAGAKQVVCLDKNFSKCDWEQECKIYMALREHLNDSERQIFDGVINLNEGFEIDSTKLLYIHGIGIEEAEKIFEPESFDFIVSRAVVEELYDPDAAFSVMNALLVPGGYMLHKIDFRDYGIFSSSGHHPLTFLTIPDSMYSLMTSDSGKPNRRLINYYYRKMAVLGYDSKILITQIVGSEDKILPHKETVVFGVDYYDSTIALINRIRPHLQAEFKDMLDEELMISGIFLIARKL